MATELEIQGILANAPQLGTASIKPRFSVKIVTEISAC